jgi:GNAT superfamily N-acetyltransferase
MRNMSASPGIPHVRPLRPDEPGALDIVFAGMSPRSRYMRFHTPTPRLTAAARRALLDVDQVDHIALVAEIDAYTPVGIGRCVRTRAPGGRVADLAVAVVDAWHRRGVGRMLVEAIVERAVAAGITRLEARVLPGNDDALGLFRAVTPTGTARFDGDALVLTADLVHAHAPEISTSDVFALFSR